MGGRLICSTTGYHHYRTGCGTVFSITPGGKESVVHTFNDGTGGADGIIPTAGLTELGGTLYGTTSAGGTYGERTIFTFNAVVALVSLSSVAHVEATQPGADREHRSLALALAASRFGSLDPSAAGVRFTLLELDCWAPRLGGPTPICSTAES
jgi:hypothetical protein